MRSRLRCPFSVLAGPGRREGGVAGASSFCMTVARPLRRRAACGDVCAVGLGPMQIAVLDVPPATVCRTPEHISQADPDMLKLALVRGGDSCVITQDGRQARLSPGEFAFYDTRRPYEVVVGTGRDRQV